MASIEYILLCGSFHIPLYSLHYSPASFKQIMLYMIIILLIHYICHAKMQLNDVIKISWLVSGISSCTDTNQYHQK